MTSTVGQAKRFCASCGVERPEGARFCASCGQSFDTRVAAPSSKPKQRKSNPLTLVILTVVVLGGCLYLLNNTTAGLSVKCHLLGDYGACMVEALGDPGPVQNILDDIGRSV
jgi:hypothetical protein